MWSEALQSLSSRGLAPHNPAVPVRDLFGLVWACLGLFGFVWACLVPLGPVWACFGRPRHDQIPQKDKSQHQALAKLNSRLFSLVWPCLGLGPVWACLGLFGLVWACLGLFGPVWACLGLFGSVWACLGLLGPVWACLGLFGLV